MSTVVAFQAAGKVNMILQPSSLSRAISPPPRKKRRHEPPNLSSGKAVSTRLPEVPLASTSAIEAGKASLEDQFSFFSTKLQSFTRSPPLSHPLLPHSQWTQMYLRHSENPDGHHFVIHQHDHPISGLHYDLRLQINSTSSCSWAIMYGLPGDPNSRRLSRNATETRIHNLWNHLIETASHQTGSMLIWDTGNYEVLPYVGSRARQKAMDRSDSDTDSDEVGSSGHAPSRKTEAQKLHDAFQQRRICLRLHGTRLPTNYTLFLRLTKDNNRAEQPRPPARKRKRAAPNSSRSRPQAYTSSPSESESDLPMNGQDPALTSTTQRRLAKSKILSFMRTESPPTKTDLETDSDAPSTNTPKASEVTTPSVTAEPSIGAASDNENTDDQEQIRVTNTYPGGAVNTINSIHQRKWYLSLDRRGCGFVPSRKESGGRAWARGPPDKAGKRQEGFERFVVRGRDAERSVVTGRLAREILEDEGVEGFVPRGLWRPVLE